MTIRRFSDRAELVAGVLACALLQSAITFAQSKPTPKPAAVAGKYDGLARGTPDGDLATTVTLVQDGSSLTGTMAAGAYAFSISAGKIDGDSLSWSFSDGNVSGSVTATYKAGAITGSWWAEGGGTGALELKKAAAK